MSALGEVAAIAPNHLGDGIMALPALAALTSTSHRLTVYAPPWGRSLYGPLGCHVRSRGAISRADVAVLFPRSFRSAWQARRADRVVGLASDGRGVLLTQAVCAGRHRGDTYRHLAEAVGCTVVGSPTYAQSLAPPGDLPRHVGLNPVSASGSVVQWAGFRGLSTRFSLPVVAYGGPGERARVAEQVPDVPNAVGLSLPDFAANLTRCALFVSNDSGAAHFARACGVPTLVIYGSTIHERTGANGAAAVQRADVPCRPCYRKRCAQRHLDCLDIDVQDVIVAIQQRWPEVLCG